MDLKTFGKTQEIQERRFAIITLEEKGLKPREISRSLNGEEPALGYEVTMDNIYNDLKWGRKELSREVREAMWDNDFMRDLQQELKQCNHSTQRIGYYKLLLSLRQDRRKRAGDYTEKVELSGSIKTKMEVEPDEHIRKVLDELTKE